MPSKVTTHLDMSATKQLLQRHVDFTRFGIGSAKKLTDLLEEVEKGETILLEENGRLVRQVSVVTINVFVDVNGDLYRLVEDRQVFDDGRLRRRNLPSSISEKLHRDEDVLIAISRALKEEIGVSEFTILTSAPSTSVEKKESSSYPGIVSYYALTKMDVLIALSEYKAEGYQETENDLTTYFVWVLTKKGG